MNDNFDVIVVGSGASAVHAGYPLVEAGLRVLMLDVGKHDGTYGSLVPRASFVEIRRSDPQQHRYLLGDRFEGIAFRGIGAAAQLTPPRQYVVEQSALLNPVRSDGFRAVESFALGGLGATWGAVAVPFRASEFASWPITRADLDAHYQIVADRIGISGAKDDLDQHFADSRWHLHSPVEIDSNAETILKLYTKKRDKLNEAGFTLGRARLAVATELHRGRGPLEYHDMEFWSDGNRAVYRPQYTLEELRTRRNFVYRRDMLVRVFDHRPDGVIEVVAENLVTGLRERIATQRLILAAGTLGTTRIVLRSLGLHGMRVPLLCNPYVYLACLNWRLVGQPVKDRRHSLCQLIALVDAGDSGTELLQAQLYSYRSLLTFRLVKESPLAHRESIRLMKMMQSYLMAINVYHADRPDPQKYVELQHDHNEHGDRLNIVYRVSEDVARDQRLKERRIMRLFRKVGCLPLKTIRPVSGASLHYGGCIPMTNQERPLTTRPSGQLRDAPGVYLADGSTFPDLPAQALTYTLMANANRIGVGLRDELLGVDSRAACSLT